MSQLINFKDEQTAAQWQSRFIWNDVLCIVIYMAAYAWTHWKKTLVITSIYRAVDPAGVHNAWRAVDVRNANFDHEQAIELATVLNEWAIYDPERPRMKCCIVYELDPEGNHNDHFHIQVHPNTTFKESENG